MVSDNIKEILVASERQGERIDVFVAAEEGITRSAVVKLAEENRITVFGAPVAKNYKIRSGDVIAIDYPPV